MANLEIRDGDNLTKYIKATGAGSDLDPFITQSLDSNSDAALDALESIANTSATTASETASIDTRVDLIQTDVGQIETLITTIGGNVDGLEGTLSNIASNVIDINTETGQIETALGTILSNTNSLISDTTNIVTYTGTAAGDTTAIASSFYVEGNSPTGINGLIPLHLDGGGVARAASHSYPVPVLIQAQRAPVTVTNSFTRPNDTTQYTTGDLLHSSTSGGRTMTQLASAVRINGGHAILRKVQLVKSSSTSLNAAFTLHLFRYSTTPTFVGDNDPAAFGTGLVTPTWFRLGTVDLVCIATGSSTTAAATVDGLDMDVFGGAANTSIGYVMSATLGYTPAAEEVFYLEFTLDQS